TPISKSWPSQWCLAANDLAIQVHGGYGYTREFKVEQFYRDNRLNPIHEGTHGIQGLDLLGRKVVMDNGAAFEQFNVVTSQSIEAAKAVGDQSLSTQAGALRAMLERLRQVTQALWAANNPALTLANSSVYLEAFGHVTLAWIWLQQACAAHGKSSDFHQGKRIAARYFFKYELPRVGPQLDLLASLDSTTLDLQERWL
ncbi:MAG: acyl-CoA dehydrogenase, partial [Panacagrimonas sp.]